MEEQKNMKCPNCGSENIQFGTSTNGGGFSLSNSCCGYLALGPLGLLCGACGSGTSTEEFWICQGCGHKFTNREGQRAKEREQATEQQKQAAKEAAHKNYLENKKVKDEMVEKYGSIAVMNKEVASLLKDKEAKTERYNKALDIFVEESIDAKIKKLNKKRKKSFELHIELLLVAIVLTIITLIFGLFPIAIPMAVFGVALFIYSIYREINPIQSKLDNIFTENSPEGKKLYDEMKTAEEVYKPWEEIMKKIDACDQYEKQINNEE